MAETKLYEKALKWKHISTATTTVIRSSPLKLHYVNVNDPVSSTTAVLYNGGSSGGAIIADIDTATAGSLGYEGVTFSGGLTVVTDGTADLTIIYE